MNQQSTFVKVVAFCLIVAGIIMRLYPFPDEQLSLMVSLSGLLLYLLIPRTRQPNRRRAMADDHS
jgi:hypothetical protein